MKLLSNCRNLNIYSLLLTLSFIFSHSLAISNIDSLRLIMKEARFSEEKMRAAVLIAEKLIPEDMDSALILLDFAAPLLKEQNDLYKSEYFNQRGIYQWYKGDYYEAIRWFKKTLQLPEKNQILLQIAEASNNIGALYRFLGVPDSAGIYLEKALIIDEARNDKPGMAKTLYDLGVLYRQTNKYELALINALRAMDIVLSGKDTSMIVHVYTVLGNIYFELDSTQLAIESHNKAIKYAKNAGIKDMIGTGYTNLTAIYCDNLSQFKETSYHFNEGMHIARELSDFKLMVTLYNNMGYAWELQKNHDQAMIFYQKAKSLLESSKIPIQEIDLYFNIGHTFKELQKSDSARMYLNKCLEIAQQIKSLKFQSKALLEIASLDSLTGDTHSAFVSYRRGIALRDSLWNNQHRSRIAELQIIYEAQKNKLYIKELEHRQNLHQAIFFLIILTLSLGFFALVVFALYFRKKRIVAQQQLVIQKQENEKAQTDLEIKRKELTLRIHTIVSFEDLIKRLEDEIHKMIEVTDHQNAETLNSVLKLLNNKEKAEETWKEFLKHFDELNDEFISKLTMRFPELSPIEVRLCTMLRLNMTTKEIADITKRAVRTIEFYRTSIRKKIGLHNNENLSTYLSVL